MVIKPFLKLKEVTLYSREELFINFIVLQLQNNLQLKRFQTIF